VRLQPAGQPPFRFTIPYRDGDVTPAGRYAVRATVRQGERLLFTTDTFTPVLGGGLRAAPAELALARCVLLRRSTGRPVTAQGLVDDMIPPGSELPPDALKGLSDIAAQVIAERLPVWQRLGIV
jgi:hypothetical protein